MRPDFLGLPVTILDTSNIYAFAMSFALHDLGTYLLDRCDFVQSCFS